ncbi:hypothetical protein ACWXVP_01970 [Mycoplasma sp. 1781]
MGHKIGWVICLIISFPILVVSSIIASITFSNEALLSNATTPLGKLVFKLNGFLKLGDIRIISYVGIAMAAIFGILSLISLIRLIKK